jgi:hypothetical protein
MENPDVRAIVRGRSPVPQSAAMRRPRQEPAAPRRRPGRTLPALVGLLLLVAACAPANPPSSPVPSAPATPSPGPTMAPSTGAGPSAAASQDAAAVYQTIEDQVVAIRQLQPKAPVNPTLLDDAGIKKYVADSFAKDNPQALIDANQRIYEAFGLLPEGASLKDLYVELLGSQVAGLYSPDDKKLYVVSKTGSLGAIEKSTFSHEYTHALQDQNFDLGSLQLDEVGQGDRSLARLSLVEGDATLSMSLWQLQHLTSAELGQLMSAAADDPSTKQLLEMPPILRESLLFPYFQGLAFVQGLQAQGGWGAVDDAFARPPASTEQILHPEKYAADEAPVAVSLPGDLAGRLGTGWKVALQDTFGEFQLALWLRQDHALSTADANAAAAGWGGDRVAEITGPNGAWAVVYRVAFDTTADATAFEKAAGSYVDGLASPASLLPGAGGKERWILIASDATSLRRVAGALGLAG